MIASASLTSHEVAFMSNPKLYSVNEIGLYLKGIEHSPKGEFDQEWICAFAPEITVPTANMQMTQSDLLEGM